MNKILKEDFDYVMEKNLDFTKFYDKTIFITGATGLIGSLLTKFFMYLNDVKKANCTIVINARNQEKAKDILGDSGYKLVLGNLTEIIHYESKVDFLFHCASITKSKEMVETPVDVTQSIVLATQNILEFCKIHDVESVVYLSSMEVYGEFEVEIEKISEENLGDLDLFNVRNCYPLSKRMAENICYSYYKQFDIPVKIARLVQTFGAGVLKSENRVFMQFLNSAIDKSDIIMHTKGESFTNTCYTADAIYGLLLLALNGENGEAYNVANENNFMTIMEMAEIVKDEIAKEKIAIKIIVDEESIGRYPKPMKNHISSKKIASLGWSPKYSTKEMFERLALYLE